MGGRADGVCVCPPPRVHTEKVFWVPNRFFKHELQPVIMGIRNGTRCLACPAAPQPTLQIPTLQNDAAEPLHRRGCC